MCGHPRTPENSVGNRLRYGCRKCAKANKRRYYYQGAGWGYTPLPISYRYALEPIKSRYRAIRNKVIGARIVDILNAQEPKDRAAYILLRIYGYDPNEVAGYFGERMEPRAERVAALVSATEHQDVYKDWGLVQQLIDEGVGEADVKEMIQISDAGWNAAKRRGDVRVQ